VSVADTGDAGDGFPDLVVGYDGRSYLFEVKNPARPPSERKLRPKQVAFRARWRGHYAVVLTLDDCLREMGFLAARVVA
jgi:hypothetical protein